jgi:hypothetical protein
MKRRVSVPWLRLGALLAMVLGGMLTTQSARADSLQYDSFWRQSTVSDFSAWTLNGVAVGGSGSSPSVQLAPGSSGLSCSSGDIDGGAASVDAASGLCAGTDPMAPGSYLSGLNYYNGGSFYYGTMTAPVVNLNSDFDQLVASTDAGVRIVYNRSDLETVWLTGSYGTVYVIYPKRWTTPTAKAMGTW